MENNLTIEQIQAVIDKGGCLVSDENEIHFGKMSLDEEFLTYQFSKSVIGGIEFGGGYYLIEDFKWREATPEEIEKYVPVEYRPKQVETQAKQTFTKSDLISFGNYLLSKEREEMVTSKPERGVAECAIVIRQVSHADIENWMAK